MTAQGALTGCRLARGLASWDCPLQADPGEGPGDCFLLTLASKPATGFQASRSVQEACGGLREVARGGVSSGTKLGSPHREALSCSASHQLPLIHPTRSSSGGRRHAGLVLLGSSWNQVPDESPPGTGRRCWLLASPQGGHS